ncbi:MAG TPA: NrsF family protein [Alphaproteobacteria bacterium]|nr:NrsF family protein [Alphaproteobacteria bacterium]
MGTTDSLISGLARDLKPVKRLASPGLRALLWLLIVAGLAAIFVAVFADMATFSRRAADPKLALELVGTLLTGILAVLAAFQLSMPDRSAAWALLPLPSFLLWLGSSGYSCWRHWVTWGPEGWQAGESAHCFAWILGFGVPLAIALLLVLRKARPLAPLRVAAMAGLGVASLSAFLLQFFHPFDVTVMDLGLHLAGVAVVTLFAGAAARPALGG